LQAVVHVLVASLGQGSDLLMSLLKPLDGHRHDLSALPVECERRDIAFVHEIQKFYRNR